MVQYNLDDSYCPHGHSWIFVNNYLGFGDYYYCPNCDKIYTPTVEEKTKKWFKEHYHSDKFQELKNLAKILDSKKRVTKEDLIKLGYLDLK